MGILSHDEILELHAAVVSARLSGSRTALLVGLDPALVAGLSEAVAPGEQVLTDLDALNAAGELQDGTVPVAIWLKNAVALVATRKEAAILQRALNQVRGPSDAIVKPAASRPRPPATSSPQNRAAPEGPAIGTPKAPTATDTALVDGSSCSIDVSSHPRERHYKLDPMYINIRRIAALTNAEAIAARGNYHSEKQAAYYLCLQYAKILKRWLDRAGRDVASFPEDWSYSELAGGTIFTVHRWFKFRNVRRLGKRGERPLAYTTFPDPGGGSTKLRLELRINTSHVVEGSPGDLMTGTVADLFVCAMTFETGPSKVTAIPIFIGHKMTQGSWGQILPAPRRKVYPE
ncbi:hypothetical protein [Sorangium sp. So ce1182]|uniref:hypothetical protein n=1 Tax=Sorangium sp. So ce1182 TaxID=3133334 RepID=UPI003F61B58A